MWPQFRRFFETLVAALLVSQGENPERQENPSSNSIQGRLQAAIPGVNRQCYESYPQTYPSAPDYRVEFYNLFVATPPTPPAAPGSTPFLDNIYQCWDKQYSGQIEEITEKVGRYVMFASFRPEHSGAVYLLRQIIEENIQPRNPGKLVTFLKYLSQHRTDIHPQLFLSALATAIEASDLEVAQYATPSLPEMFPSKFFANVYGHFTDGPNVLQNRDLQQCTKVNERWGWENGMENRLWYFREDIQLNMHHWSWHLRHPHITSRPLNRRGELFYQFHHDLVARYSAERLSHGFSDYIVDPVIPVENLKIPVGYDSNLRDGVSTNTWMNRPNNTVLSNATLPSEELRETLANHIKWWEQLDRVTRTNGTFSGYTGKYAVLEDGINTFGETLENSNWTANQYIYGQYGWHNMAHDLLGSMVFKQGQDPDVTGVLTDTATAARDVAFYRIHNAVNQMFMQFKHNLLTPYQLDSGIHQLILPGVQAKSISVRSLVEKSETNVLETHWQNRNMDIDGGLDFNSNNSTRYNKLRVCAKHLDNKPFQYNIQLENTANIPKSVYIRIFMAPRSRNGIRFNLPDQKQLYFVMDAFPYTLQPGLNNVARLSTESSLTTDWWIPKADWIPGSYTQNQHCHCGWPQHLLLPKGTEEGMEFDLVYIVTDGSDFTPPDARLSCTKAYVHCGYRGDQTYPDSKPMGYPFDRRVNPDIVSETDYIDKLISSVPNMGQTMVKIFHDDQIPREHLE